MLNSTNNNPGNLIFKDISLNNFFWEKGYAIVNLLSEKDALKLMDEIKNLLPADSFAPSSLNGRSDYHCTFIDDNLDYRRKANELISLYFTEPINAVLNNYKILTGNFYVKQPGNGKFEMHTNWHTAPSVQDVTLTVWCPLLPVNEMNGALKVVEGSHKLTFDVSFPFGDYYFKDIESELAAKHFKTFNLQPGECVIFDDTLIHYSDENRSSLPRVAVQIETVSASAQPVMYAIHPQKGEGFLTMHKVDNEFYLSSNHRTLVDSITNQPYYGEIPNLNRKLSIKEFENRLANQQAIRRMVMADDQSFLNSEEKENTNAPVTKTDKNKGKWFKFFNFNKTSN